MFFSRSTLFGAKEFGLFEIYGVSARTRGRNVELVRTRRSKRSILRDWADVFNGLFFHDKKFIKPVSFLIL